MVVLMGAIGLMRLMVKRERIPQSEIRGSTEFAKVSPKSTNPFRRWCSGL
jgi:hypothetical protein